MQVKLALVALLGTAFAAPTIKRDVTTITNALASVNGATANLDNAVEAFDGTLTSALTIAGDSNDVLTAINNAITEVEGTSDVGLLGTLPVAGSTIQLIGTVDKTINDLISKKSLFDSSGTSSVVLSQLQSLSAASNTLGSDITSKVPALADILAESLNALISAAFKKGINAFSS